MQDAQIKKCMFRHFLHQGKKSSCNLPFNESDLFEFFVAIGQPHLQRCHDTSTALSCSFSSRHSGERLTLAETWLWHVWVKGHEIGHGQTIEHGIYFVEIHIETV